MRIQGEAFTLPQSTRFARGFDSGFAYRYEASGVFTEETMHRQIWGYVERFVLAVLLLAVVVLGIRDYQLRNDYRIELVRHPHSVGVFVNGEVLHWWLVADDAEVQITGGPGADIRNLAFDHHDGRLVQIDIIDPDQRAYQQFKTNRSEPTKFSETTDTIESNRN